MLDNGATVVPVEIEPIPDVVVVVVVRLFVFSKLRLTFELSISSVFMLFDSV